jgi:hypothetical protein
MVAALGSAMGFAVSTSLQHHAAGDTPAHVRGATRLLAHLLRRPRWLGGQVLALMSFGLHAFALHAGALALVQPIVVSGIVFAVPMRAAMSRQRPPAGEIRAVLITAVGLATFLVAAGTMVGDTGLDSQGVALVVAVLAAATAAAIYVAAGRMPTTALRAGAYGVTAGILFGLVATLVKLSLARLHDGGVAALVTGWPMWALVVMGLCGVATNQRAYRVGALSASNPILNIVNVIVALTCGVVIFSEIPAHGVGALTAELVALGCMAVGLTQLSAHADLDLPTPV